MNEEDTTHWPLVGVGIAIIVATIGTCHVRADDKERFNAATKLTLGRALAGEGGNANDAHVIAHLLYRRWHATRDRMGWSFDGQIRAYCSPLKLSRRTARARRIRALTWEALPERIRVAVEAFSRGELRDPCPQAWHFDRRASLAWVRLPRVCSRLATYNVFYGR